MSTPIEGQPAASADPTTPGPATGAGRPHRFGQHPLRIATWALSGLALAAAIVIAVLPLPHPAAGGTCGPGTGSEPAVVAFFDPVSIGAGPEQRSTAVDELDWLAFVGECQASTNARMVDALALLLLSGFFLLVASPMVGRAWRRPQLAYAYGVPPGWYRDPAGSSLWRWWDGHRWSHETRGEAPAAGAPPPLLPGSGAPPTTAGPAPEAPPSEGGAPPLT